MPCDVDAQRAQLLDQAPDFRTTSPDLVGDLRAADGDGCVVHQQADNASKAGVGFLCRNCVLGLASANWRRRLDAGIITSERLCLAGSVVDAGTNAPELA